MRSRTSLSLSGGVLSTLFACALLPSACSSTPAAEDGAGGSVSSNVVVGIPAIVSNGAFTNVYVYPTPSTETWEQHMAALRPADADTFSRAAIDAATQKLLTPTWPSYFDTLHQVGGINPPQFFGSAVASQACVDAALRDAYNGVVQEPAVRTLSACHPDGMAPSPQVNLIFSPDIKVGKISWPTAQQPEMCSQGVGGWHAWGINTPNFTALPTSIACVGSGGAAAFTSFTRVMSHEIVETLSDPAGFGIGDAPGYDDELGDLCQKLPDAWTTVGGLSLARYWSETDGNCQPRLDPPSNSAATTWVLGEAAPLQRLTGDVHAFSLDVPSARLLTDAPVSQVAVVIQTGGDDLRGAGDNADVTLNLTGGRSATTADVNLGHHWNNNETYSANLTIPYGARVSDITGITISTHFAGGISGDNWNVDKVALVVSYPKGSVITSAPRMPTVDSWLDASEAPLVRFTGNVHDARLALTPTDVGLPVSALDVVISTGADDLRGGGNAGDDRDVNVELTSGRIITVTNVNQGSSWPTWSIHHVSIPIPTNLKGGDVKAVSLHTGFGGGISGDNWNVNRVQLLATLVLQPPTVTGLRAGAGPFAGGNNVTVQGFGFATDGFTRVTIGGKSAAIVGIPCANGDGACCESTTACTVAVPAPQLPVACNHDHPSQSVAVQVTRDQLVSNGNVQYDYDETPQCVGVSCGTNAVYTTAGLCQAIGASCGFGALIGPNGQCQAVGAACGENSVFSNAGVCVVIGSGCVMNGDAPGVWSAGGQCWPQSITCPPGEAPAGPPGGQYCASTTPEDAGAHGHTGSGGGGGGGGGLGGGSHCKTCPAEQ